MIWASERSPSRSFGASSTRSPILRRCTSAERNQARNRAAPRHHRRDVLRRCGILRERAPASEDPADPARRFWTAPFLRSIFPPRASTGLFCTSSEARAHRAPPCLRGEPGTEENGHHFARPGREACNHGGGFEILKQSRVTVTLFFYLKLRRGGSQGFHLQEGGGGSRIARLHPHKGAYGAFVIC